MNSELYKRIFTSIILCGILTAMFFFNYILIISLILIAIISWIEFYGLIIKIFRNKIIKFVYKTLSLVYVSFFSIIFYLSFSSTFPDKIFYLYILLICIFTDIGGLIFGKIFKGPKLTKISPKKTISGLIGSFLFSFLLMFLMNYFYYFENNISLIVLTFFVSLSSQLGDLFFSYLKRKANVKDTGDLLPGHGGFLDRIDGVLVGFPVGLLIYNF